jgi:hypothetical protein
MAAYGANAEQTIQSNGFVVFSSAIIPCDLGLIQHVNETPLFSLNGWRQNNCPCRSNVPTYYFMDFNANVALAEGATVVPISIVVSIDGIPYSLSEMDSTPAAAEEYNHVSIRVPIPILSRCCQNVAIQNTSTQPITMKNTYISFERLDLQN